MIEIKHLDIQFKQQVIFKNANFKTCPLFPCFFFLLFQFFIFRSGMKHLSTARPFSLMLDYRQKYHTRS